MLAGFALAAGNLSKGGDPYRLAGYGALAGVAAFPAIIFSASAELAHLFRAGVALIGFGSGLFAVSTMTAAMSITDNEQRGLALGAWGAVQATATGIAIALSGGIRDGVSSLAANGSLGNVLNAPATGYNAVYNLEILLLFLTLIAIGPLVRRTAVGTDSPNPKFGLAEFPG